MAARTCKTCDQVRARPGERECPVCWLVRTLAEEHDAGEHKGTVNASCIACTRAERDRSRLYPVNSAKGRQRRAEGLATSHKDCDHAMTPGERAKCRRRQNKVT